MDQLVRETREHLKSCGCDFRAVVGFGHLGDGNLHLNIAASNYTKELKQSLEPFVYEWIEKNGGSISAEHGIGVAKKDYLGYSKDRNSIQVMRDLKRLFD